MQTLTEENYLKSILKLSQADEKKISATAIAEEMEVNAASVIDMLKKLQDKNLIVYDKKNGANLTSLGNKLAVEIVRKHRLWEVFLFEKLNFTWDEVHGMAEQLEHIKHHQLANRLDEFLEFPQFDPHGDPIPRADGKFPEIAKVLLSEKKIGDSCKIVSIKDTSAEFLQYLNELSVNINTVIIIRKKIAFDNSLVISVNDKEFSVSEKFANSIFVKS